MATMLANSEAWPGLATAVSLNNGGSSGIDIIESAIRLIESEPEVHSVGLGAWPNAAGELELDACIMDGDSRACGAVGALRGFLHPITIARRVMEQLPHVFLAGDGAARFAAEIGAERAELLTAIAVDRYHQWIDMVTTPEHRGSWPKVPLISYAARALEPTDPKGTTVILTLDDNGSMAAGVSTSGWAWKYPGRLGDSPIVGAGCYVDSRYGAAACTGKGELAIRGCTSFSVVAAMRLGMATREACLQAAADLVELEKPFSGVVTIHALSASGEHHVLRAGGNSEGSYFYWQGNEPGFLKCAAEKYPAS
ncbi:MAG: asparaginase [Spirochaetales bacterium]|nr:asparaginase [Spirochaetales bacterium]